MENLHHYKYVIIDSSKENHNNVDAKFKVQIPQGITGTTRVCVKSFSMPNSYHNIYGVRRWALGDMSQRFNSYFSAGAIKSEADAGFEKRGPDKNVLDVEGIDIRADTRRVGIAQFYS